jgi:hypothetical protein
MNQTQISAVLESRECKRHTEEWDETVDAIRFGNPTYNLCDCAILCLWGHRKGDVSILENDMETLDVHHFWRPLQCK